MADTTPAISTDLEPFRLDDELRERVRERLAEQTRRAWAIAELAGLRLAGWARTEHRELVLEQRINALDDQQLLLLWDGVDPTPAQPLPDPDTVMAEVRARTFTCGRVQIQLPRGVAV